MTYLRRSSSDISGSTKHGSNLIAIARLDLSKGPRGYVESLKEVLNQVSKNVSALLTLPPTNVLKDFISGRRDYISYRNSLRTLTNRLSLLTRSKQISLIITPVLRKAGNKIYMTTLIISPLGHYMFKGRGFISPNVVISPSKNVELARVANVDLCFLFIKDLEAPEVARICKFSGSDAIVAVNPPLLTQRDPNLTLNLSIARAVENSLPVIGLGGYLSTEGVQQPTYLINSNGNVVDLYKDMDPSVFEVEVRKINSKVRFDIVKKYISLIKELT